MVSNSLRFRSRIRLFGCRADGWPPLLTTIITFTIADDQPFPWIVPFLPPLEILRTCEMEHYIPNFAFHQIDFQTLAHLTVDGKDPLLPLRFSSHLLTHDALFSRLFSLPDLKDMNVNRVGHRRKLLMKFHSIPADTKKVTKSR